MPTDCELAWAAGLFDGEGSTIPTNNSLRRIGIGIAVGQDSPRGEVPPQVPEVLVRFQSAIGGRGVIRGPFPRTRSDGTTRYPWMFSTVGAAALESLQLLWPWLSGPKKVQAMRVLDRYCTQPPPMPPAERGRLAHAAWMAAHSPEERSAIARAREAKKREARLLG